MLRGFNQHTVATLGALFVLALVVAGVQGCQEARPPAPVVASPPARPAAPIPVPVTPVAPPTGQPSEAVLFAQDSMRVIDNTIEPAWQRTLQAVQQNPAQADAALADFVSRIQAAITNTDAVLERQGISRYSGPPPVRHLCACLDAYKQAGGYLRAYVSMGSEKYWTDAQAAYAEARSERRALGVLGSPP
jgi:hypothetical protein